MLLLLATYSLLYFPDGVTPPVAEVTQKRVEEFNKSKKNLDNYVKYIKKNQELRFNPEAENAIEYIKKVERLYKAKAVVLIMAREQCEYLIGMRYELEKEIEAYESWKGNAEKRENEKTKVIELQITDLRRENDTIKVRVSVFAQCILENPKGLSEEKIKFFEECEKIRDEIPELENSDNVSYNIKFKTEIDKMNGVGGLRQNFNKNMMLNEVNVSLLKFQENEERVTALGETLKERQKNRSMPNIDNIKFRREVIEKARLLVSSSSDVYDNARSISIYSELMIQSLEDLSDKLIDPSDKISKFTQDIVAKEKELNLSLKLFSEEKANPGRKTPEQIFLGPKKNEKKNP